MRKIIVAIVLFIAILWVLSLFDKPQADPEVAPLPDFELPALVLPESRPFLMGFAYQPYDWSEEAFAKTFDFVATHGDMIVHYLDEGAPWEEAFLQKRYPANVEEDLNRRVSNRRGGQEVVVMANPLGLDRASLGGNWGTDHGMDPAKNEGRPGRWANNKQIAVLETGFNAKGVAYWDRRISGNEISQDLYTRFLLSEAARLNFTFVGWWVHRDYDLLWEKMSAGGVDDAFNQWNATGLQDGAGKPRKSLLTWDRWHALPVVRQNTHAADR